MTAFTIDRTVTGPIETNTYLVIDNQKRCLVIDPSLGCREVIKKINSGGFLPQAIVLTHGHYDHIMGLPEMLREFGDLPVYLHDGDVPMFRENRVNGSRILGFDFSARIKPLPLTEGPIVIGNIPVTVFHIPGHTPGGCAILVGNNCLTGDTLFAGTIGRSDLPGGDGELLVREIRAKLLTLPEDTLVFPGHDVSSTIGREKKSNPEL
jgi:hydroxyacylglutathione hydrolase